MNQRMTRWVVPPTVLIAFALASAAPPAQPDGAKSANAAGGPPAQDAVRAYVESLRGDLSCGKVHTINEVMHLSDDEGKIFWPIYKEYEDELFANGDRRLALIKQYASSLASHSMTDEQARKLAPAWFEYQAQQLETLKQYHGIIQEKLSPTRAAQFVQIEHRFGLLVDLTIASQLPMIEPQTTPTAQPRQ
jgi:hypothetical protein